MYRSGLVTGVLPDAECPGSSTSLRRRRVSWVLYLSVSTPSVLDPGGRSKGGLRRHELCRGPCAIREVAETHVLNYPLHFTGRPRKGTRPVEYPRRIS